MAMKNYNIKITDEDEKMIRFIRKEGCVNISQFIRKCVKDKYDETKNRGKSKIN
jgi:hypothetical protein